MNRKTFFFVSLLNLLCILSSNAQETEYAQYEKTTTIQNREIHQIVAEYDGKYYYCVDNSPLAGNHYFDAVEISKEVDNYFNFHLATPTDLIFYNTITDADFILTI